MMVIKIMMIMVMIVRMIIIITVQVCQEGQGGHLASLDHRRLPLASSPPSPPPIWDPTDPHEVQGNYSSTRSWEKYGWGGECGGGLPLNG